MRIYLVFKITYTIRQSAHDLKEQVSHVCLKSVHDSRTLVDRESINETVKVGKAEV